MAEVLISPESTLEFLYSSALGAFANSNLTPTFSLVAGQQYRVFWDGSEYARTGFAFTFADGSECVGVGNPIAAGQESNGDLFCIVYDKTHDHMHHLSLEQTATHTVSVYLVESAEVGIIQYDRNGNPMEFYGKKVLRVDTTDGGTKDFVGATLVEKTVELDFSASDMEVVPGEDEVFSKVSIPVPENLTPGNIAEGVNIAGIVGALTGGKLNYGRFTGNNEAAVVTHGLGVIPDIVIIYGGNGNKTYLWHAFGFSKAFVDVVGFSVSQVFSNSASTASVYNNSIGIDTTSGGVIHDAGTETFTVGNASRYPAPSANYYWLAVGGLT